MESEKHGHSLESRDGSVDSTTLSEDLLAEALKIFQKSKELRRNDGDLKPSDDIREV